MNNINPIPKYNGDIVVDCVIDGVIDGVVDGIVDGIVDGVVDGVVDDILGAFTISVGDDTVCVILGVVVMPDFGATIDNDTSGFGGTDVGGADGSDIGVFVSFELFDDALQL